MPAPVGWREDANPDIVILAVGKTLGATMDKGRWIELGLLTGSRELLEAHPRLLRSLQFGDDDYQGCVYDVTPWVLGDRGDGPWYADDLGARFPHLQTVSDYLDVPSWLLDNEPAVHSQVCLGQDLDPVSALPDGTVLDGAETAAARLEASEMRRQLERIRRDFADDPEAVVGQVKELVESTCKTILGLTGDGPETQLEIPALVSRTLSHLGVHPSTIGDGRDRKEAAALKRLFGGLSSVLQGASELRNARGTGHGRSGVPLVDGALARLAAGMVLPAVVYLCEAYDMTTAEGVAFAKLDQIQQPSDSAPGGIAGGPRFEEFGHIAVGAMVEHPAFGRGKVVSTQGSGRHKEAEVRFADAVGTKRLLLAHARLQLVPS